MKYIPPSNAKNPTDPYIDADPMQGIKGSTVPAAVFNATQAEILNAITAAGIEPSATDLTQLAQTIARKANVSFDNVPGNIDFVVERWRNGANWWFRFRSGTILQGGRIQTTIVLGTLFNLNLPYTNTNYEVFVSNRSRVNATVSAWASTTSAFRIETSNQNGDSFALPVAWLAIGV
jgi:hypothetical protein